MARDFSPEQKMRILRQLDEMEETIQEIQRDVETIKQIYQLLYPERYKEIEEQVREDDRL